MRWQRMAWLAVSFSLGTTAGAAYDIQDRFELINDRFSTDEMLNPSGHDFLLEVNGAFSAKLLDVVDDGDKVSKKDDEDKALEYLNKYKDNEYTVKIGTQLGIPLPTFYLGKLKIVPDLRIHGRGLVNFDIATRPITSETVLSFVDESKIRDMLGDQELADTVMEKLQDQDFLTELLSGGTGEILAKFKAADYDLAEQFIKDNFTEVQFDAIKEKVAESSDAQKWTIPATDGSEPVLSAYTRLDVKGGLNLNYFYDKWFGNLNLYAFHRTDYLKSLTAGSFAKGAKPLDDVKKLNSTIFANVDFKLGHQFGRYSVYGAVEEIKVAEVKARNKESTKPYYKSDPLLRVHGEAKFQWGGLSFTPFVGAFKRSFYDVSDGIYAGADAGAFIFGERIGILARAMVDPGYFTLAGQVKFWLVEADLSIKTPVKSEVEGQKVSNLYAANIRIAI